MAIIVKSVIIEKSCRQHTSPTSIRPFKYLENSIVGVILRILFSKLTFKFDNIYYYTSF